MIEKELATFDYDHNKKMVRVNFLSNVNNIPDHIPRLLAEFEEKLNELNNDPDIEMVVISAHKNTPSLNFHSFVSGPLDVRVISKWEKIVVLLERLKKVTLAALEGEVSESMLQLALVCDHRICSPNTTIHFTAIRSGYLPGMALFRIAKFIGLGRAKQLLFTGEVIGAEQALTLGFVDEIVDDLDRGILEFRKFTEHKHIEAIIMARRLLNESFSQSYEDEIGGYLAAQVRCLEALQAEKDNQRHKEN